jgi:hypothetical protein
MENILTREVVANLTDFLKCPQKILCRYLGISPVALSQNIEKPFKSILNNKVGKRLDTFLFLVDCIKKDSTLDAAIIHRVLTVPSYEMKDGWKIDAITALHDECDKEMLVEIFNSSLLTLRERFDKKPVRDGMYESIHH